MPRLSVEGPFEYTDLRILDAKLSEIASGTRRLEVDVAPGIYRVEARVPGAIDEKLIDVPDDHDVHVSDFQLSLDSPAPLPTARSHHENHEQWAVSASHHVDVSYAGSARGRATGRLFLLIRSDGSPRQAPAAIRIMTRDGQVIARLDRDGLVRNDAGLCAVNIELPPGTYILAQDEKRLGLRGQAVFVEYGWQTQVFAPWDVDDVGLSRALVSMAPVNQGFRPSPRRYEYVEAALNGLASGRVVLTTQEESELLNAKFQNPMLGIIGAYAYISRNQIDYRRLERIALNLLELLPTSPDAHLLNIIARTSLASKFPNQRQREFDDPPMFAFGNELLIGRAVEQDYLVPAWSWVAELSLVQTTGSVFTRWNMDVDPGEQLRSLGAHLGDSQRDDPASLTEMARAARLPRSIIREVVAQMASRAPSR